MIRLWRRFMAWLDADDLAAEWLTAATVKELRSAEPHVCLGTMESHIRILREIGASPRSIEFAERLLAEQRAKYAAVAPHCARCAKGAAHCREEKAV